MSYKDKLASRYVGWQFEGLSLCPYTRDRSQAELTARFRYVVLQDGVEVPQKSAVHLPEMVALTKLELEDPSMGARANIMGVRGELREEALMKFAALEARKYTAEIIPLRQMAAETPSDQLQLQMKG